MLICPICKASIEEKYKFCPNCGNAIEEIKKNEEPVESGIEYVTCKYCGEENEPGLSFCSSCGAKMGNEKIEFHKVHKQVSEIVPPKKNEEHFNKKKQQTKNKKPKHEPLLKKVEIKNSQDFNTKKIAIVFSGILVFALIILYFSGAFDEPKISSVENFPAANRQQNSGIDLANIDRINQLDAQLKAEPNNFDLTLQLAHLRNDSGFKPEAITLYKKYLEKFPNDADVLVDMGVCYFDLQKYDEAIPLMEKAIKINPTHQIAHMNLGIVNLAKGNIEKSKEWLQKAVDIDPNSEVGKKAKQLLTSH
ncbi:MAG: tetratricopeptide repeat protein [Ignavibacteriaceae bacterium]|jgi:tetratricopeptide (TPR) repeat protein